MVCTINYYLLFIYLFIYDITTCMAGPHWGTRQEQVFFSFSLQVREVGGVAINAPRGFSQIWLQVREKSVFIYLKPQYIYI
jgi:hypothetical protein